jgi:hypothetical protein
VRVLVTIVTANEGSQVDHSIMRGQHSGSRGFWTTLPGTITAIAGLITAVAGVLAVVLGAGGSEKPSSPESSGRPVAARVSSADGNTDRSERPPDLTRADWARQANAICQEAVADVAALGEPQADPVSYVSQVAEIERGVVADLRALPAPPVDQQRIAQLATVWLQATNHWDSVAASLQAGDPYAADKATREAKTGLASGNSIADHLGAKTCAYGEF